MLQVIAEVSRFFAETYTVTVCPTIRFELLYVTVQQIGVCRVNEKEFDPDETVIVFVPQCSVTDKPKPETCVTSILYEPGVKPLQEA
jgi:hypothetical protein